MHKNLGKSQHDFIIKESYTECNLSCIKIIKKHTGQHLLTWGNIEEISLKLER